MPEILFTLDPATIIQLILTVVMPIAVGLVTRPETPAAVKAWLLATFTLVSAMLTQLAVAISIGEPFNIGMALLSVIPQFAFSVANYYGLLKPIGVTKAAQQVDSTTIVK